MNHEENKHTHPAELDMENLNHISGRGTTVKLIIAVNLRCRDCGAVWSEFENCTSCPKCGSNNISTTHVGV